MTARPHRPDDTASLLTVDIAMIVCAGLVAAWPLADAYGGERWAVAMAVGLAGGALIALGCRHIGAGLGSIASGVFVAYLVLGPAFAVPDFATWGVLPNWATLQVLLTGSVQVWSDAIALVAPLGSNGVVLIIPWIIGLVAGAAAAVLLWSARFEAAAGGVFCAVFLTAGFYGDLVTRFTVFRGLLLVIVLVVWLRWRAQRHVQDRWGRRVAWTSAVVLVAMMGGVTVTELVEDADREVLREYTTPHFDPRDHASPLSRLRVLTGHHETTELFVITGLEAGDRLRLATMTYFDGQAWSAAGSPGASAEGIGVFRRLPSLARAGYGDGVIVTILDYEDVWIPGVGEPIGLEVVNELETIDPRAAARTLANTQTGTLVQVDGARWGQTYNIRYHAPPEADEDAIREAGVGDAPLVEPASIPESLIERSEAWVEEAGNPTGGELAQVLADGFAEQGFYSDGRPDQTTSPAGHGTRRIEQMAGSTFMVGNAEQYASAMALAALHHGLPARVVIGFDVTHDDGFVFGSDALAWTEVHLEGLGWVAFEPTPPVTQRLSPVEGDLSQLPPPPERPERPDLTERDPDESSPVTRAVRASAPWLLIVLIGIGAGLVIVATLKVVRRRRRRAAASAALRFSGGWREIADRARDLGTVLAPSATRTEGGATLESAYPETGVLAIADRADRGTFGADPLSDAQADEYWADVNTALRRMRNAAPWWRRPLAWFSPRSLFHRDR